MKILITNIVTLNAGDAAILYATTEILRAAFGKDVQFIVYDKHGKLPQRYYPNISFRKLLYLTREENKGNGLWDRISFRIGLSAIKHGLPLIPSIFLNNTEQRDLLEYKYADLIISSGGTYLVENYSLDARIFDYRISLFFGKPLVFFTQSLGPFKNAENRKSLRPIFDAAIAILVRDKQSLQNLIELGVTNKSVHLAADAAFALSDIDALKTVRRHTGQAGRRLAVAISVREWRHFKNIEPTHGMNQYVQTLRAVTEHLVNHHNAEITFLSTCQGMPEYWTDDSKVAQTIVDGLTEQTRQSVSVDSTFHDPLVLSQMLRNYDFVIATRMHMAILALGVGTPVLPIAYEFKMHELFKTLGAERWSQDIETMSADKVVKTVDEFVESLPEIRNTIFTAVQKEHENALASGYLVREAFDRWQSVAR